MTPEQYKAKNQSRLIDQITKDRIAELTQKLKAAQDRGDKRQIARLLDLLKTNKAILDLTGA